MPHTRTVTGFTALLAIVLVPTVCGMAHAQPALPPVVELSIRTGAVTFTDLATGATLRQSDMEALVDGWTSRSWLVYIHGFNASARSGSSLARAKQIAGSGTAILTLDWPSGSRLTAESAKAAYEAATKSGVTFATEVARLLWGRSTSLSVDVAAHSMGGEVLRAMLTHPAIPDAGVRHALLIHAYVSAERLDSSKAALARTVARGITAYVGSTDKVLQIGMGITGSERVVGDMWRPVDSANTWYELVNTECLIPAKARDPRQLVAHFPEYEPFYADVRHARDASLGPSPFRIYTRFEPGGLNPPYELWTLLDQVGCPKIKRRSLAVVPRPLK